MFSSRSIHAQSICTHYSCFENMGQFATLKKSWSKICVAKSRLQKTGSLLYKNTRRRSQAASFLFWITICSLLFAIHVSDLIFLKVPDPKKLSGRPEISGCRRIGRQFQTFVYIEPNSFLGQSRIKCILLSFKRHLRSLID